MIYELAGVSGVDPAPYTLRELDWMADGRLKSEWAQSSLIILKLHNANFMPELTLREINPYFEEKQEE